MPKTNPNVDRLKANVAAAKQKQADQEAKTGVVQDAVSSANDLALAARSIFLGGQTSFALNDGRVVNIDPAKMKHLPLVMNFFGALVSRIDTGALVEIIETIADKQKLAMLAGKAPNEINLQELATGDLVTKLVGRSSLVMTLLGAVTAELPTLAPVFSNLTQAEYEDLTMEEGALVAGGIFLVNYRFFTQSLRPLLAEFIIGWASKKLAENKPNNAKK